MHTRVFERFPSQCQSSLSPADGVDGLPLLPWQRTTCTDTAVAEGRGQVTGRPHCHKFTVVDDAQHFSFLGLPTRGTRSPRIFLAIGSPVAAGGGNGLDGGTEDTWADRESGGHDRRAAIEENRTGYLWQRFVE